MWKLIGTSLLFLLALLVLFKAPTNFFWKVSVAITEFPFIPIFLTLFFIAVSLKSFPYRNITILLSIINLVIYFLPILTAYPIGKQIKEDLTKLFPYQENENFLKHPYSFLKMFSGIGKGKVPYVRMEYKSLPEKKLNIDFYSAGKVKAPCIIIIHGGSWSEGNSEQLPALNSYLAQQGYHVAAINYRLSPKYKSPAPIEDTKDAINYLVSVSKTLNIDTSNFVLLGRSAGGQIALVSAYSFNDPRIKGVISFYAPADMVWGGHIKVSKWVLDTEKVFKDYLGGNIDEVPDKFSESTAIEYVKRNSTPTLIIHGENDAMVAYDHSVHLDKKLSENQVRHYFLKLRYATHGCDYNINGPSGQITTYAIERFINSVTHH
ncbi:MAG: alpha/beta hydrolase [Bacteroidetes bacterium]|nr:alpha/beta hydrolase [Bacteroidota bacterium]